jgi:hypothetical protein
MPFPPYVCSVVPDDDERAWPVQGQGPYQCGCTVAANALNLLAGRQLYDKDDFVAEAGLLYQPALGGTPSPLTGWLIQRRGGGTHFGNLSRTDAEAVLRDLLGRGVPVVVELWRNRVGPFTVYGQHSVLLVGYSTPHPDRGGVPHEEYYFVDSQWPRLGEFRLDSNDRDVDGVATRMPGNHTLDRAEFLRLFETGIYFPVFRSQAEHDAWCAAHLRRLPGPPLVGRLGAALLTGSYDDWRGPRTNESGDAGS